MGRSRTDLFRTITILRESEKILPVESKAFKQVVIKASDADLAHIEETLLEAAEVSSGVMEDVTTLAELIYPTFDDKDSAVAFVKENSNFASLEFAGFDVFAIKESQYGEDGKYVGKKDVYHAIIKVKYDGSEYGFGFNEKQKAVSYTLDGDGPFYDNMRSKLTEYDRTIKLIKYVVEYVMGIM